MHNKQYIKVDGYCETTNTIYEFLGCYWHFHCIPDCKFTKDKHPFHRNPNNKKLNIDLYMKTIERLELLTDSKYKVKYIWECEYLKGLNYNVYHSSDWYSLDIYSIE